MFVGEKYLRFEDISPITFITFDTFTVSKQQYFTEYLDCLAEMVNGLSRDNAIDARHG